MDQSDPKVENHLFTSFKRGERAVSILWIEHVLTKAGYNCSGGELSSLL